jgi:hypothetical protein
MEFIQNRICLRLYGISCTMKMKGLFAVGGEDVDLCG